MPETGIQAPRILGIWDELDLADAAPELPSVDTGILTPVYALEPGEFAARQILGKQTGLDLNGATVSSDIADDLTWSGPTPPDLARTRTYNVFLNLAGTGTVTPIVIAVIILDPNAVANAYLTQLTVANPGAAWLGPIRCDPNFDVRIQTLTNGGVGDTLDIHATGFQVPAGLRCPVVFAAGEAAEKAD